jgi:hypothetical protein
MSHNSNAISAHRATTSERTLPFTKKNTDSNKITLVAITANKFYIQQNTRNHTKTMQPLLTLHHRTDSTAAQKSGNYLQP